MTDLMFPLGLASGVTCLALLVFLNTRAREWVRDHPNARSLHASPVPRIGGAAIWLGVAAGWYVVREDAFMRLLLALAPVLAISLLDDFKSISPMWRLLVQAGVAVLVLGVMTSGPWSWIGYSGAVLFLIWSANLYNFMDGIDGLAGGMALFGFSGYAIAAGLAGHVGLMILCGTVAAAAAGFLLFNFHPAKVFMGDVGSVPLGLLAGLVGILGVREAIWPVWFPFTIFSVFFVDASVTLLKRAWCGEALWRAHRDHYYQRLARMGWGHRNTALVCYAAMLISILAALLARTATDVVQQFIVIGMSVCYAAGLIYVDRRWHAFNSEARHV